VFYEGNKILTMLEQKKIPLGIQCFTGSTALVEVMGATGFDFVMFDAEHSANDARAMEELVRTATFAGMASYIRVPDPHNATDVRRALEAGAEGLVLPEVHSVADINAAAKSAYFPPKGDRGICPATRSADYNFRRFVESTKRNNRVVALVPEIENPDGVAQIEEICAHPDVHMVIFGQGDLAFSRGEGSAMDRGAQTAKDYRTVLAVGRKHGVAVIGGPVLVPTADACRRRCRPASLYSALASIRWASVAGARARSAPWPRACAANPSGPARQCPRAASPIELALHLEFQGD
jgi:2-keto-3-deoxy-L-rhamnonate aldolase RhmA